MNNRTPATPAPRNGALGTARTVALPGPEQIDDDPVSPLEASVSLVRSKTGRPLMMVWREDGQLRTRRVFDVAGLLIAAPLAVGALALIRSLTARLTPVRTRIDMGPGGWVSFKDHPAANGPRRVVGLRRRPARPSPERSRDGRPRWARLLKAEPFS